MDNVLLLKATVPIHSVHLMDLCIGGKQVLHISTLNLMLLLRRLTGGDVIKRHSDSPIRDVPEASMKNAASQWKQSSLLRHCAASQLHKLQTEMVHYRKTQEHAYFILCLMRAGYLRLFNEYISTSLYSMCFYSSTRYYCARRDGKGRRCNITSTLLEHASFPEATMDF